MELYALRDMKEGATIVDPDLQEVDIFYLEDLLQKGRDGARLLKASSSEYEEDVAIKLFPKPLVDHCCNGFTNEMKAVSKLSHPSLVKYHAFYKDALIKHQEGEEESEFTRFSVVIREYIPSGDLFQLISKEPLSEKLARTLFKQMISVIDYIHNQKIVHLDLKLESFLVTEQGNVKLIDFDKAQNFQLKSTVGLLQGTSGYRPPEFIKRSCQDLQAADIYSLGVILFMMVTGTPPYTEIKESNGSITFDRYYEALRKDVGRFWKAHEHHRADDDRETLSKEFKQLIEGMLAEKPEARMKIEEIKASKWYKGATCSQEELRQSFNDHC